MAKISQLALAIKTCFKRTFAGRLAGPQAALAALSLVLVVACAAAAISYAQGYDPIAALSGSLRTTADAPGKSDALAGPVADTSTGSSRQEEVSAVTDSETLHAATSDAEGGAQDQSDGKAQVSAGGAVSVQGDSGTASSTEGEAAQSAQHSAKQPGQQAAANGESDAQQEASGSASADADKGGVAADSRIRVSVTIDGSAAGAGARTYTVKLQPGATAYDALVATGTSVNARATVYGTYVAAIGGLAEKEHGGSSGWVYAVGGVEPQTAASNYVLSSGDQLVWTYVNVSA